MRHPTPSELFLYSIGAFIGGVGAGLIFETKTWWVLSTAIGSLFLFALWHRSPKAIAGALVLLSVGAGIAWSEFHEARSEEVVQEYSMRFGKEIDIMGRIAEDPQPGNATTYFVLQPEESEGRIALFVTPPTSLSYATRIRVKGVLEEPPEFEDFSYREYLKVRRVYGVLYQPEISLVEREVYSHPGAYALSLVYKVKHQFRKTIALYIAPPEREILGAMLLGDKRQIPNELKEQLSIAGIRHITAISGMHVAILANIVMALFLGIGLWRHHAFYGTVVLIFLFAVFTGVQPSAVRAGIMGGTLLLSQHIGRPGISLRILCYAAALMLLANPFLFYDVGFQLSFLAVLGIILLLPLIQQKFAKIPSSLYGIRDILGMTLSAQVFTLPILLSQFGLFSIASFASNLLVVPVLPFVLGFGFLLMLGGWMWSGIGIIVGIPLQVMLSYIVWIAETFASFSFSAVSGGDIGLQWLLVLYLPLFIFLVKKSRQRNFVPYE